MLHKADIRQLFSFYKCNSMIYRPGYFFFCLINILK